MLTADSILRKTEKGVEEMDTRAYHLPAKLRAALILVDGESSLGEILERCGEFAERVEQQIVELLESGFVEDLTEYAEVEEAEAETATEAEPVVRDMRNF